MSEAVEKLGRREEIVRAAGEMFGARGYHATSMRELAHALELQGSSLYAHIASKEDILHAIVDRAANAFAAAAAQVPAGPPPERLAGLIAAHLKVIAHELDNAAVFFQDWVHLSADRRSLLVARRDAYQALFRQAIEDGVADGSFSPVDPSLATLVVLSALNFSYHWYDPAGRLSLSEVAAGYASVLVDGLRSRGPRADRAGGRP